MRYFAYGSNLDATQMRRRCPDSRPLGPARLDFYRLRFDGSSANWSMAAVANITPSALRMVWGALYEVSEADLELLDEFEHVPVNYHRFVVTVESEDHGTSEAVTYLRTPKQLGAPTAEYLGVVLKGAMDNHLSVEYLAELVEQAALTIGD